MIAHDPTRPVHFSDLRAIGQSPAHYLDRLTRPREQTASMRFGTLVHALVLGGQATIFSGERRGRAWAAFLEAHQGEAIYTEDEHARAQLCASAVLASPVAAPWLVGRRELHIEWTLDGRAVSSRLDVLGDGFVTELKTAHTTRPWEFGRVCTGPMAYHAQLAFYAQAAQLPNAELYIVGVESSSPYAVTCYRLTPGAVDAGRKLIRSWWETLMVCERSGQWPGYAQSVLELDVEDDGGMVWDEARS